MKTYPVFLVGLHRRRCVVLGGGGEAKRKVEGLLACDAAVTLVAAQITESLRVHAEAGRLNWIPRGYRRGDLRGVFVVVSTLTDPEVNERVYREAESAGALCNVIDDTKRCSFIAGSVVRRGELTVGISTGGNAPALAVRLRERLERELGPEYARFLELAAELRGSLVQRYPAFEERRDFWYALVDSDVLESLRMGRLDRARRRITELMA
jgi:siroheme synthase-like protein